MSLKVIVVFVVTVQMALDREDHLSCMIPEAQVLEESVGSF